MRSRDTFIIRHLFEQRYRVRYEQELGELLDELEGDGGAAAHSTWDLLRSAARSHIDALSPVGSGASSIAGVSTVALLAFAGWLFSALALGKLAEGLPHAYSFLGLLGGGSNARGNVDPTSNVELIVAGVLMTLGLISGAMALVATVWHLPRVFKRPTWNDLRGPVVGLAIIGATVVGALGFTVRWAHRLSVAARNGGDTAYSDFVVLVGILILISMIAAFFALSVVARRTSAFDAYAGTRGRAPMLASAALALGFIGGVLHLIAIVGPRGIGAPILSCMLLNLGATAAALWSTRRVALTLR